MELKVFGYLLFCACVTVSTSTTIEDGYRVATKALTEYLNTGVRPSNLSYALQQCPLPGILRHYPEEKALSDSGICVLCNLVADVLIMERRLGMSDVQIAAEASFICIALKIENARVCDGVIKANVDIFIYIIDNNPEMTGSRICGLLLRGNNCDSSGNYEWTINVPSGKTIDKVAANETETFNILHISDIHYDPLYTPGKTNKCGEPLCCQNDQEDGTDASSSCGYWSDYSDADLPFHTMQATLKQTNTHEFDYVYYTGDFVAHRVWSTSVVNNTRDIVAVTDQFKNYFNVPVYPVLGNHEPHPVNLFSSDGVNDATLSSQWVFDLVAEQWGDWLTEEAKQTILKGGYYTVSPRKGFRVIALNSNVCYTVNWWLINDSEDPYGQLAWLAEVLLEAENNQESVHILAHVPVGDSSCLDTWSREYSKLVSRFANTITGQFTGHTHKDEFRVFYDINDVTQPIGVSWNGASVTTFTDVNPSYKLYQIDDYTFDVLDYEEWTFNLTLANLNPENDIEWYKLYSFKDAYGVDSLKPADIDSLLIKMTQDHNLVLKYYNFKYRNSDVVNEQNCDETCQKNLLCKMATTVYGETQQCDKLKELYDENK